MLFIHKLNQNILRERGNGNVGINGIFILSVKKTEREKYWGKREKRQRKYFFLTNIFLCVYIR